MFFMPFQILGVWLRGLLAVALLGAAAFLLAEWYAHRETVVVEAERGAPRPAERDDRAPPQPGEAPEQGRVRVVTWQFGLNRETAYLLGGLALLGWSLGGGWLAGSPRWLRRRGADEPRADAGAEVRRLRRPDGTELAVHLSGPAAAPALVLVHGWGLDSDEWYYARRELGRDHRLLAWDLPGLGQSARPPDRDWALERLARDLDAVIALAGEPVVLVGHSIGGMVLLTYCRLFPEALGSRVRGLVLAHTTYTNPVKTTSKAWLYTALQKPVLEPLCHLMVWLAPVVRVLNWLTYLNGSAHRSTERSSFSGRETRGQLDFLTRYYCKAAPDVVARGMLAMFRYDARDVLPAVGVPTLVVTGDGDATCTPEASRFMAATIPGARLVVLTPARHCGLFEQHGPFHSAVAEFVATRLPRAGAGRQASPVGRQAPAT